MYNEEPIPKYQIGDKVRVKFGHFTGRVFTLERPNQILTVRGMNEAGYVSDEGVGFIESDLEKVENQSDE